jgi:hypothetical protein
MISTYLAGKYKTYGSARETAEIVDDLQETSHAKIKRKYQMRLD